MCLREWHLWRPRERSHARHTRLSFKGDGKVGKVGKG